MSNWLEYTIFDDAFIVQVVIFLNTLAFSKAVSIAVSKLRESLNHIMIFNPLDENNIQWFDCAARQQ